MKLDFYHNKIVSDVISEEFEICFKNELVPLLTAKHGEIDSVQMYEDYISDNLCSGGYWYYPLTLVIREEIKTQWVRWEINKTDFDDGLPYAFSGRGSIGFELCDGPREFEERIAGRSRYYAGGSIGVRIEIVKGDAYHLSGRYSQTFIDEMARQLTPAIESATGVTGIADSSVELVMVFASGTYMEHISENITYRRLMLVDKVSAPRDFWIKWTRLDGAVAYSVSASVGAENILFELGEDVDHKIREKEYRYLLSSSGERYHNSMGRKKVTEWRDVIKRAARRGELQKVENDYELAPETLKLEERIAGLLGKKPTQNNEPEKEPIPCVSEEKPESEEYARAMEKARMVVEGGNDDEPDGPTLEEIAEEIPAECEEESNCEIDAVDDLSDDENDEISDEEEMDEPSDDEVEEILDMVEDIKEQMIAAANDDTDGELEFEEVDESSDEEDVEFDFEGEPDDEKEERTAEIKDDADSDIFEDDTEDESIDIFADSEEEPISSEAPEVDVVVEDEPEEEFVIHDTPEEETVVEDEADDGFAVDDIPEEELVIEEDSDDELTTEDLPIEEDEEFIISDIEEEESEGEYSCEAVDGKENSVASAEEEVVEQPEQEEADEALPETVETEATTESEPKIVEHQTKPYTEPGLAERVADIRAEIETKIRLEYEIKAREKAEKELFELRERMQKQQTESELTIAELRSENERLRRDYDRLLEQIESERFARESEEARRRIEEKQLREDIEKQLRAEAEERERLAESARVAEEERRRLEEENARLAREMEEDARADAERERREEEERRQEAERIRTAERERIIREQEEARERARAAMPEMGDGKYSYTTKIVKLIFPRNVDPNITTRIHEVIKTTVDYYGKDNVSLRIRASIPDSRTVLLEFVDIPLEEMPLLGNIIKVLGNAGLGIIKAIVE